MLKANMNVVQHLQICFLKHIEKESVEIIVSFMSDAKRTEFMQVTPTAVVVRDDNNEAKTYEKPTVLMADFGLWVKTEETLEMFTWERVMRVSFGDSESIQKVWEEAVLTVFEDLLDDLEDEFEDEEEPAAEPAAEPENKTEEPASADDPESNPYA
tara:strand:- start:5 stop:472 length:468 start_codon:yes stop_codon:yes gene_type:complete